MFVYQRVIGYDHPPRTGKLVPWFHGSVGFTPTSRGSKWATKRGRPPAMPPKSCLGTPQTEWWVILIFLNSVDLTSSDCWKLLWHFAGISVWIFLLISLKELFLGHPMTWSNCIASHSTTGSVGKWDSPKIQWFIIIFPIDNCPCQAKVEKQKLCII